MRDERLLVVGDDLLDLVPVADAPDRVPVLLDEVDVLAHQLAAAAVARQYAVAVAQELLEVHQQVVALHEYADEERRAEADLADQHGRVRVPGQHRPQQEDLVRRRVRLREVAAEEHEDVQQQERHYRALDQLGRAAEADLLQAAADRHDAVLVQEHVLRHAVDLEQLPARDEVLEVDLLRAHVVREVGRRLVDQAADQVGEDEQADHRHDLQLLDRVAERDRVDQQEGAAEEGELVAGEPGRALVLPGDAEERVGDELEGEDPGADHRAEGVQQHDQVGEEADALAEDALDALVVGLRVGAREAVVQQHRRVEADEGGEREQQDHAHYADALRAVRQVEEAGAHRRDDQQQDVAAQAAVLHAGEGAGEPRAVRARGLVVAQQRAVGL